MNGNIASFGECRSVEAKGNSGPPPTSPRRICVTNAHTISGSAWQKSGQLTAQRMYKEGRGLLDVTTGATGHSNENIKNHKLPFLYS